AGAGEDEVAEAGQAGEGFRPRTKLAPEAHKLREAAGDESPCGTPAERASRHDAGRDGEHVLCRAADLDAAQVGRMVGTKGRRAERFGELFRDGFIRRAECHSRRQSARDISGETWSG